MAKKPFYEYRIVTPVGPDNDGNIPLIELDIKRDDDPGIHTISEIKKDREQLPRSDKDTPLTTDDVQLNVVPGKDLKWLIEMYWLRYMQTLISLNQLI